ncbi:MAG: TIGR03087 family PEP-CTERM/XrtA system glycosyltransferase [Pseudomonadota bacterium]
MTLSRKSILFLVHRIPYPPNKGDKIRSFNELKFLSENFSIDLVSLTDDSDDVKYTEDLKQYCRKVHVCYIPPLKAKVRGMANLLAGGAISTAYFYETRVQKIVNACLSANDYHAVICFSSPMAEYVFRAEDQFRRSNTKLIMDFCDLDSEKWKQYSVEKRFPMSWIFRLESQRLLDYEIRTNRFFHHSIFVSEKEKLLFRLRYPEARNLISISNGVDTGFFSPVEPLKTRSEPTLLFTGAMDYFANIDGVLWFMKEIFPLVKKASPNVRFIIAGRNPPRVIRRLAESPNVVVTGFVKDIRTCYQEADIAVIPLRIARGVQNKILEGMAMAKPVVATPCAADGIDAKVGIHLLVSDSPQKFADTISRLLSSEHSRKNIATQALNHVRHRYAWSKCLSGFLGLLS